MSQSRRQFVRTLAAASGYLLSGVSSKIRAYDNCHEETRVLGFGASFDSNGVGSHSLSIKNWKLGDCELKDVAIVFPDKRPDACSFKGLVGTHFTHRKDVWHFRLQLFTPSDNVVHFDQLWDGPEMSEKDRPLFHSWQFGFTGPETAVDTMRARAICCC